MKIAHNHYYYILLSCNISFSHAIFSVFDGMLAPYDQLAISQLKMLLSVSYA
jgi:hypothetical protein